MRFPILNRIRLILWALGVASMLLGAFTGYRTASNRDHLTPQYPESLRINGVVRYVTLTEMHIIAISFVVAFVCIAGSISIAKYIRDMSDNDPPQP